MRNFILLSVLSASLIALPAQAQYRYLPPDRDGGGVALIDSWIHQYLRRAPNREDIAHGQQIDEGTLDPTMVLAGVLGCDEYYDKRAGGDDGRYVQTLFRDIVGRPPSSRERAYWEDRLSQTPQNADARIDFAYDFLRRFPPRMTPPAPPAEILDHRPYDR